MAAVPSSIHSEFHLKESRLKLVSDCPFKSKFFHISTLTSTSREGEFRSEVQRGFRMSQYCIIPAFMHRNVTKRGEKKKKKEKKKRLGNGKIEMFKVKLKRRQRMNLGAL